MSASQPHTPAKSSTGIAGLDAILHGGLPQGRLYLVQGTPGTGKTTLALQFLTAGRDAGEKGLLVLLSESASEIRQIAASHGLDLDGIEIHTLTAAEAAALLDNRQTLFHSADIELDGIIASLTDKVRQVNPARVVVDSVAEIRLLASSATRYRRQVLTLKEVMNEVGATTLFTDASTTDHDTTQIQELAHGVIELQRNPVKYGNLRRRLEVSKLRGMDYHDGLHDFDIEHGGLRVYPRIEIPEAPGHTELQSVDSGVPALNEMLGGGLERGTCCLLQGAVGTGKTTLCTLYALSAARRGEHAAIFLFDERPETFFIRAKSMDMDLSTYVEKGLVHVHRINPGSISPGEFAGQITDEVERHDAKVVVIDSLTGYYHGMPEQPPLLTQMHEVLEYMSHHGVLSLLVTAQQSMPGLSPNATLSVEMSYLADAILMLRHFEAGGRLLKAISVLKKRHGPHEHTIRELRINDVGIEIGDPLTGFQGILTGVPRYVGDDDDLMQPS